VEIEENLRCRQKSLDAVSDATQNDREDLVRTAAETGRGRDKDFRGPR
jgi:hypothetical protein